MRDMFPGFSYKYPEGDELSKLWQEAIFVFDANMLLNVYRYKPDSVDRYFEILERLKEQIWIPYQAAYEYYSNRERVINERGKIGENVKNYLRSISFKINDLLGSDENSHFLDKSLLTKNIIKELDKSASKAFEKGNENKRIMAQLKRNDRHRARIEEIFQGKVGLPYSRDQLMEKYKQAELRFALEIPPGWKDKNDKDSFRKYGDVILWFQIMDYARSIKKPIIFVSDDVKKDWWIVDDSKNLVQPLPELIQEMFSESGSLFYMNPGYEFIKIAMQVLHFAEDSEIVENVKEVTEQNSTLVEQSNRHVMKFKKNEALQSVTNWLMAMYSNASVEFDVPIAIIDDDFFDAVLTKSDGTKIFIDVEEIPEFPTTNKIRSYMNRMRFLVEPDEDRLIVLVSDDLNYVRLANSNMSVFQSFPEDMCIVVGYINADKKFSPKSTYPDDSFLLAN